MERCTSLSNGILTVHQGGSGTVGTSYYKKSGSTVSAKLGYSRGGTSHYASAVSIGSGQTKSHTWSLGADAYCSNIFGLMNSGGSTYQTPTSHC
ncbi:hypothetical protein [Streptomyces sp. Adlamb9]